MPQKKKWVSPVLLEIIDLAAAGQLDALESLASSEMVAARDKYGSTALHWACGERAHPLHFAARNGYVEACQVLVALGADPDAKAEGDVTPFQLAAWQLRWEVVRYLGAVVPIGAPNAFACVASHWVALAPRDRARDGRQLRVAEYLRERCGDEFWRARNAQGHTPLHKAAFSGHAGLCDWLRTVVGAVDDAPDDHGNYASDLATESGHVDLANALRAIAAPTRQADLEFLGLDADATKADVRAAFRRVALETHPDKRGDARAFERAREAYGRLTGAEVGAANPLRDADRLKLLLLEDPARPIDDDDDDDDFETRLAAILLEQPNGLSLSQLRKRYLRTWHLDLPDPKQNGYRSLVHFVRARAHRVARLEYNAKNQVILYSRLDRASVQRALFLADDAHYPP
ncbi:hypothetical protein CTAYLR_007790 [Chrysophaeum taylorii]|uniref:J domain-containing protein n=1 Tax=Chrysophaeum taylorii TaxID=2483200 RepID=A0AAD7UJL6_9STRA|nr:hypothetical protein CTAYLR_007790 [Chrysophaeum taylorii]